MEKLIIVIILVIVAVIAIPNLGIGSKATYVGTVTKTYVKNDVYMVAVKLKSGENIVFKNVDAIGKFNSSDVFASLEVGKTYIFETKGKRIPFLSAYPNIITCTLEE